MKLYIADVSFAPGLYELFEEMGVDRGLVSYWECVASQARPCGRFGYFKDRDLFLDSGAYTAYTIGADIKVDEFCDFIIEHGVELYCNVDVIRDEDRTRRNQARMESRGLSPIPVFHIGEGWDYLDELLERYEYVALGVAGTQGERRCDAFLEGSFARIAKAWPKRVHGFGITTQRYLERYPFYSVDSSSASLAGGFGRVFYWKGRRLVSGSYRDPAIGAKFAHLVDDAEESRHVVRKAHNVKMQLMLEEYVTELWRRRGVEWAD